MLGHSIESNLKYYSFAQKDYLDNARAILDSACDSSPVETLVHSMEPIGTPQRSSFFQKRKPRTLELSSILGLHPTAEDGP
jgi:hypothetical protein